MSSDLASKTVADLGSRIFGSDWAAPMARLTGMNARTLSRIKAAALSGVEYPAAKAVLAELPSALQALTHAAETAADRLGINRRPS